MRAGSAARSGRDIVAYFAGQLANLVNGDDRLDQAEEIVVVKPFQLFERVRRLLIANRRYSEGLVGAWTYPPPDGVEEAADFYFDCVLDRPIAQRRDEPTSAHNLAALVASRAAGPRPAAPSDGPLSTWRALTGGALRLRRFRQRSELFEFSNRILECLDAANRPYAEALRLGLCPKEWLVGEAAVGVDTLKSANAFLNALKSEMRGELGRRPARHELEAAFASAPIPGCGNAQDFASGAFGAAVLTRLAGEDRTTLAPFDAIEATKRAGLAEAADAPLMNAEEAAPFLEGAVEAGAIAPAERDLLAAIIGGESLAAALGADLFLRRRLKNDFDGDLTASVEDLSSRTGRFVGRASARP